ncbi:MAG: ferritin-like domain-containing protein [Acidimicrobiales bacterium]
MEFDIEAYKTKTERLRWDDLDFGTFRSNPLPEWALRCLRYMHDVEFHTACYLRDLLCSPAHADPDVTAFLSFWVFEEYWHGEALSAVLAAHGEAHGAKRVGIVRRRLGLADKLRPIGMSLASWLAGEDFVAVHMAWGAINEWTTQAGYAQLARRAGHPVLGELLRRIMRQEGRHIDFYASQARSRLAASRWARRLTRFALRHLWAPVGSGVMPKSETAHLATHLLGGDDGAEITARIDRRVDQLPGQGGLQLLGRAVSRLAPNPPGSPQLERLSA